MFKTFNATLNRRRLLLGLAAASTAAATSAAIASVQPVTAENAELLRLGDELPAVHGRFVATTAKLQAVVRKWLPRWPSIPDAIIEARGEWVWSGLARDLTGAGQLVNGEAVRLHSLSWLDGEAARLRKSLVSSRRRNPLPPTEVAERLARASKLESVADQLRVYLAECDRVREASGYEPAKARNTAALEALSALVGEIIRQPAETMDGVLIKAEALDAWQSVPKPERLFVIKGWNWPGVLAADVLRIAARSA